MLWLSPDFGVTFDEWNRQTHGEKIWSFYAGEVPASEFAGTASRLYGGFFDVLAVGLQRVLPLDPFVVRHGLNATFGWLGVVFCGAWATRIAGRGVGLLAMAFLVLLPRYFGHAMNNPKDIPFAALATAALFVIAGIPARYPFLTWPRVAGLALTIGLALSVRPGGLLLLGYAGCALAVQVLRSRDFDWRRLAGTAARFALVALLAMTVPLPFWPWLQTRPYLGLIEALADVSNFEWNGSVLLDGRDVRATMLPWTYVPTWLLYTTPLVGLVGLALSLAQLRPERRCGFRPWGSGPWRCSPSSTSSRDTRPCTGASAIFSSSSHRSRYSWRSGGRAGCGRAAGRSSRRPRWRWRSGWRSRRGSICATIPTRSSTSIRWREGLAARSAGSTWTTGGTACCRRSSRWRAWPAGRACPCP